VRAAVAAMPAGRSCGCASALKYAILTDRKVIPEATKEKLGLLLDKYL
jgi:5'-methylthioadenosine phosphorylase